jgi:hypothetical protein
MTSKLEDRPRGKYNSKIDRFQDLDRPGRRSINISQRNLTAMNHAEMIAKWDEHISFEFSSRDVSSTIATMVKDAYVNHVPVMTGGYGHDALRRFYAEDLFR